MSAGNSTRRVVITGIGMVTPLGNDAETTWGNLIKGRSGIGRITRFDPSGLPSRIAGEVKGFQPEPYLLQKDIKRLDPFVHYATAAAAMAAEDAGLVRFDRMSDIGASTAPAPSGIPAGQRCASVAFRDRSLARAGVIIGSSRGGICSLENAVAAHVKDGKPFSAYLMSSSTIIMAASCISMKFGTRGHTAGVSTACASGTHAIGEAYRMIRRGDCDLAFAGGTEAPICRLAVGGYGISGALSGRNGDPERASRPFDRQRDGFVIAEGAGVMILEELSHALARGANAYAELAGYGTSSDAFHQTKPDIDGEAAAMTRALQDSGIAPDEVHYINAHGTSTLLGDAAEAAAIRKAFADVSGRIPVSSSKSMLGHMLGAAGAVEAAVTALSLYKGLIVPTINLEDADPVCDLGHVTSVTQREMQCAITNSFGFGGVNAVLVLKKF